MVNRGTGEVVAVGLYNTIGDLMASEVSAQVRIAGTGVGSQQPGEMYEVVHSTLNDPHLSHNQLAWGTRSDGGSNRSSLGARLAIQLSISAALGPHEKQAWDRRRLRVLFGQGHEARGRRGLLHV